MMILFFKQTYSEYFRRQKPKRKFSKYSVKFLHLRGPSSFLTLAQYFHPLYLAPHPHPPRPPHFSPFPLSPSQCSKRLHDCFETAALPPVDLPPTATRAEREHAKKLYNDEIKRLLTFVVVGGGPTGVEFLGELHDLLDESFTRLYPHLQGKPRLKLYEASGSVLSAFDRSLRDYALRSLVDEHTEVRLGSAVKSVEPTAVVLHTGERIPCGLVVWR